MCFDKKTSLLTFSISVVCSLCLLHNGIKHNNKNDIYAAVLTFLIGLMQLIEYFLWDNQNCNIKNHYASLLIIVVLFLQGIVANILFYYLYVQKEYVISKKTFIIIGLLYFGFTIYLLQWLNKKKLCSKKSKNSCRLSWAPYSELKNNKLLFITHLVFYALMGLIVFLNSSNTDLISKYPFRYSLLSITLIFSLFYTFIYEKGNILDLLNNADVFGSLWCFLAVGLGIVGVFHI